MIPNAPVRLVVTLNGCGGAGDEGDASALVGEQSDQCESEAGRPSGDGDAKIFDPGIGWHRYCLRLMRDTSYKLK